ncbi:MAG: PEP-CTERM sorting domain-containing protein [Phycisphaerales bacterium]|nr:PEP-CTERM sorting domain-containing protein [Phycisphaerales bacterium]
MKKMFALIAVAGLAAAASADPATGLFKWEVSSDGGATWSSGITVNSGAAYKIRGSASWTDVAGTTSVGFAGATFEQIDLASANASDTFGGVSGSGTPTYVTRLQGTPETWTLQAGSGASAGGLKLDQATTTARTNFGQLPQTLPGGIPNPNFKTDNPLVVFEMDAIAGSDGRTISISGTWTRLGTPATNEFKVYTTSTGTNKKPTTEATQMGASVEIIPAPSSLALLGLGGLVAGRRRR